MFHPKGKYIHGIAHWKEKYIHIHGACLPCPGVHYCTHCCSGQRRPWLSVRLSTGAHQSAGHRCRLPGGHRSTSHWQPSIWWQPTFHIILSLVNFCMVFAAGVPVAPSHTVCFQGMSTCHQRPGLSTVCHKRQYFSVSYFLINVIISFQLLGCDE